MTGRQATLHSTHPGQASHVSGAWSALLTSSARPWQAAAVTALLTTVAARPWGAGALAWVAFVPLFSTHWRVRGILQATGVSALGALGIVVVAYEPAMELGAAWYAFALLVGTLPFATAMGLAQFVNDRLKLAPERTPFIAGLFWVTAEYLVSQPALLGRVALPLTAVGYTQVGLPTVHLARLSSVTAVSAALLLMNAVASSLLICHVAKRPKRWPQQLGIGAALVALPLAVVASAPAAAEPGSTVEVAVVQPNHPTGILAASRVEPAAESTVLNHLVELGRSAGATATTRPVSLLVFPEGAWPGTLSTTSPDAALSTESRAALAQLPPSLIGAAGVATDSAGDVRGRTNSAFLWLDDTLSHAYDKYHLVPVAEASLIRGEKPPVFPLPTEEGSGELRVSPFICYDIVFAGSVRAAARNGATLIATLTDDAFAAHSEIPEQHLRLARVRAIESGLPVAFASNSGPSALVDGTGRVVAELAAGESALLRAGLTVGAHSTPYVRYGDWVGALACLAVMFFLTLSIRGAAGPRGGAPRISSH